MFSLLEERMLYVVFCSNSDLALVGLIIWDECTMANRKAVEALDENLRDIRQNYRPMGGITLLFCGDFRHTLPIVPRGTKADESAACLCNI